MDMAEKAQRSTPGPFVVWVPAKITTPLVFASPHSGRFYPPEFLKASNLGPQAIRRSEDAYVDELLKTAPSLGVPVLSATHARAYIDLNRDPFELDQSMFVGLLPAHAKTKTAKVAAGLGSVARIVAEGQEIYRKKMPVAEALSRIDTLHRPYHAELRRLLDDARRAFGFSVLVDWHSMPNAATAGAAAADIILGDRFATSCAPIVVELVERLFRSLELKTARNTPFAGGHTTEKYGDPANGFHSLQIEINRSLYLDEMTISVHDGFERARQKFAWFISALANVDWPSLRETLGPSAVTRLAGE